MPPKTPPRPRIPRRPVHGVLLLDKPLGLSSNDALQKVKRLLRAEKAGHTGTLDPLATGLLPLCFGAATKFSQVSLDADKRYTATLQLGVTTTTADAEGEVVETRPVCRSDGTPITRDDVVAACAAFIGEIDQLPPMFSALKRDGKPLYEYARAGIEIDRQPRSVTIHAIGVGDSVPAAPGLTGDAATGPADVPSDAIDSAAANALPPEGAAETAAAATQFTLDIRCTKGTYIRTLAEDIGKALGCGAHLIALRRTETGPLTLTEAWTLAQLQAMDEPAITAALHPADHLLADWPLVRLDADNAGRFLSGLRRRMPELPDMAHVRVFGPEQSAFLGSGHVSAGELISDRLLSPTEVQGLLDSACVPEEP